MANDGDRRIYSDTSTYIMDWLVAEPVKKPLMLESSADDEAKRVNTLMAMLSKDSGGDCSNVLPFKTRKK